MLTIFTPTYNRVHTIKRTYQSLLNQTCDDFEWLVVDDGSTDNTEEYFLSIAREAHFPVRYIKQPNRGKYIAYNNGLRNAKGEFFMCVDSDDWMPNNAVETILKYADNLRQDEKLAGLVALKEYPDKSIIGRPFRDDIKRCGLYGLEIKCQRGERSLVFKTAIAKQFPFPEEAGEKFMTESVIYDRYEGLFEFVVTNDVLTTCEYLQEGLSSNPRKLMLSNPAGYKLYFSQRINLQSSWGERLANILKYHAFRVIYGGSLYDYKGKYHLWVAVVKPLGIIMRTIYRNSK